MKACADANSAEPRGAAPYLSHVSVSQGGATIAETQDLEPLFGS